MSMVLRAVLGAVVSAAAAIGVVSAADWIAADRAPAEGAQVEQGERETPAMAADTPDSTLDAAGPEPAEPTRFDRFINPEGAPNRAAQANAVCGYSRSLSPGGTVIRIIGTPAVNLTLNRADAGDGEVLRTFSASADAVHAFATSDGSLIIQAGHSDRDGLNGRVFVLDEDGFPTFSEPLLQRGRIALACDDAAAAAEILNTVFAELGEPVDPVRAGVRTMQVGDGVDSWEYPVAEGVVEACTSEQTLAELPAGALFLLTAEFDVNARYGELMEHDMSGESLAGVEEPMVYVTLASIDEESGFGNLTRYRVPVSWSFLPVGEDAVSPVFRFSAIEVRSWTISPDGWRSHSIEGDPVESVSIPCDDPDAGAAALEAVRETALSDSP